MKLSISNIAWDSKDDIVVYPLMKKYGYVGLEIAPTRVFPMQPYDNLEQVKKWYNDLFNEYEFMVSSMQSIWYGRGENLFASEEERYTLTDYTKKSINFAEVIHCKNLVFGCPKNRNMTDGSNSNIAVKFFKEIGDYAASKGTVIGMEANPPIYNTNFINDTLSALNLIECVNSEGFLLNLDVGTMIYNNEDVSELEGKVHLINHVHISEPWLKPIEKRTFHTELKQVLEEGNYQGFISIEMGKTEELSVIERKLEYVREIFR